MGQASGTPEGLGAPSISSIYRYDACRFQTSVMETNKQARYTIISAAARAGFVGAAALLDAKYTYDENRTNEKFFWKRIA